MICGTVWLLLWMVGCCAGLRLSGSGVSAASVWRRVFQRVARAVLQARDTDPLIAELCRSEDGHEGHVCCISAYSYTHEALNRC